MPVSLFSSWLSLSLCRLEGLDFTPSGGGGLWLEEAKEFNQNGPVQRALSKPIVDFTAATTTVKHQAAKARPRGRKNKPQHAHKVMAGGRHGHPSWPPCAASGITSSSWGDCQTDTLKRQLSWRSQCSSHLLALAGNETPRAETYKPSERFLEVWLASSTHAVLRPSLLLFPIPYSRSLPSHAPCAHRR